MWDYRSEAWARKFFENWRAQLKWQRLKSYEKFVEGLNNKIRVIQRRAYGLHDEEYLKLKVLTCMLPEL
jgi:transposase